MPREHVEDDVERGQVGRVVHAEAHAHQLRTARPARGAALEALGRLGRSREQRAQERGRIGHDFRVVVRQGIQRGGDERRVRQPRLDIELGSWHG